MSQPINLSKAERFQVDKNRRAALQRLARNQKPVYFSASKRFDNTVRRATPQEVNYVDLASASYAASTTGSITLIATIAQGASVNQRIGKRAYYKSLLMRGHVISGTTTTIADCGYMIVYDKRPTGALPAITDILTGITTYAFMNDNNTSRFEVVRRKDFINIGNSATPSTGLEGYSLDEFIPLTKRPITFESAGTGAIGDIDMGALYFVTFSSIAAGTAAPSITVSFRTRFTEQ